MEKYSNQGHNPQIKTLSKAMRRGSAIAKRRGIKKTKNVLFKYNAKGEVCGACALGMALIGKYGVEEATKLYSFKSMPNYEEFKGLTDKARCLVEKSKLKLFYLKNYKVVQVVAHMNDNVNKPVEKIAEVLEKCGL